jgi:hypothetical protein
MSRFLRLALPHPPSGDLRWKADQAYHRQVTLAIIAMAMFEARKEIKRKIQSEGRVKLRRGPARDITAMAKAMVEANPAEFIAKAKASGVVQDELRRL